MSLLVIKLSDIERTINKSINTLIDTFKITGEIGGWHQYIFEEKVGSVATSQGVACFAYTNKEFAKIPLAINLLKNEQFNEGGFTLRILSKFPIVESTSWVLLGIRDIKTEIKEEIVAKGAEWLKDNRNDDSGWGPIKGMPSRVYATALAIWALLTANNRKYQTILNEGIDWIKNARNSDGCWGELPRNDRSTPFHTAFVIFVLRLCGFSVDLDIISKAINWLNDQWDKMNMWEFYKETTNLVEHYDVETAPNWTRIIWNHFVTPWATIALLSCGVLNKKVFKSIEWLISSQTNEGGWKTSNVGVLTLWAIHDALFCLISFLDHIANLQNYDSIELHSDVLVLKGEFSLERRLKNLIDLTLIFMKKYWAGIIISLYLLIGWIYVLKNLLSIESYFLGLIIPISLLVIQWLIGKMVVIET